MSMLAQAELDGQHLTDDEIFAFLRLLLPAGAETTYRSSGNLLFGLLNDPDQLDALRADRSLMQQAIEEGLRWEPPLLTIIRTATRDTVVEGVADPGRARWSSSTWARRTTTRSTGPIPSSSTSSGRSASTSRSRSARTCASGCTSPAWRRGSCSSGSSTGCPDLRLDPDEPRAVHHRHDVPEPGPPPRRLGLSPRPAPGYRKHDAEHARARIASPPVISPTCAIRLAGPRARARSRRPAALDTNTRTTPDDHRDHGERHGRRSRPKTRDQQPRRSRRPSRHRPSRSSGRAPVARARCWPSWTLPVRDYRTIRTHCPASAPRQPATSYRARPPGAPGRSPTRAPMDDFEPIDTTCMRCGKPARLRFAGPVPELRGRADRPLPRASPARSRPRSTSRR